MKKLLGAVAVAAALSLTGWTSLAPANAAQPTPAMSHQASLADAKSTDFSAQRRRYYRGYRGYYGPRYYRPYYAPRYYYRPRPYYYRPYGYGYRPIGYGYRPYGYGYRPAYYRPYGYGYGYRPLGYGYRPYGFGPGLSIGFGF